MPTERKSLPGEPTRAMLDAWSAVMRGVARHRPSIQWSGLHYSDSESLMVDAYQAMLNAAPPELPAVNSASRQALASDRSSAEAPSETTPRGAHHVSPDPVRDSAKQPAVAALPAVLLCPWELEPESRAGKIFNEWLEKEGRSADDLERDLWVPIRELERELATQKALVNQRDESIELLYVDRKDAEAALASASMRRMGPKTCNAPSGAIINMKLDGSGEWYCHGCGASQLEPKCRFNKSVPKGHTPPEGGTPK